MVRCCLILLGIQVFVQQSMQEITLLPKNCSVNVTEISTQYRSDLRRYRACLDNPIFVILNLCERPRYVWRTISVVKVSERKICCNDTIPFNETACSKEIDTLIVQQESATARMDKCPGDNCTEGNITEVDMAQNAGQRNEGESGGLNLYLLIPTSVSGTFIIVISTVVLVVCLQKKKRKRVER